MDESSSMNSLEPLSQAISTNYQNKDFDDYSSDLELANDDTLRTDDENLCYICYDPETKTHVSCVKCNKKFHIQCLKSLHDDSCPFCKKSWKRSDEYARVQDLQLL